MRNKKLVFSSLAIGTAVAAYLFKNRTNKKIESEAIANFDINKYLGLWYEIARIDTYWEKNKSNVTARYLRNYDDTIEVINRGYDNKKKIWNRSKGIAKQLNKGVGKFKLSFLEPVYSSYNVIAIEQDYTYALVAGKNTDYLWILSRSKTIPEDIRHQFIEKAQQLGYDTERLQWTIHDNR